LSATQGGWPIVHPGCVEHLLSGSAVQAVGVPEHVPVPFVHVHPLAGRQAVLLVLDVQGLEVPPQVPVPFSQVQPLAGRQAVGDVFVEHASGVPMQSAVEDHVQPLDERQVVLEVCEAQGVVVPWQTPEPGFQVHPLVSPPLDVHVELVVLAEQAAGVPVHVGRLYVQPLFWQVVWLVFAAQVVVGVPLQTPITLSQMQPD
jgi:hypothetical protein